MPVRSKWTADAFLIASGVEKSYVVGTNRLPVLKGLDVSLEKGEMVAVVGASGVGKSTLLHVLGGLDAADDGQVRIGETDLTALTDAEVVAFRNRHVGFVFQFHHLLPEFTALENAEMPMRIARRAARRGHASAPTNCCGGSASASGSSTGPGCCRAASSSGSRSRARW